MRSFDAKSVVIWRVAGGIAVLGRRIDNQPYRTSIDRAGWALAAGGGLGGAACMALTVLGGRGSAGALGLALLLGGVFAMLAIAAVGGPLWLALHAAGRRGPGYAAALGAVLGAILFIAGQTDGIAGLDGDLASDSLTDWLRATGGCLTTAAIAGLIALVMWRVAYRRDGDAAP